MSRGDMFSRWSERRARVAREEAEAKASAEAVPAAPDPQTPEEEDALLAELGLPRPEDVAGPEIRKFLARGVPEIFRRRALRALWRSDPTFAVLDGLNDYDEDFTLPEFNQKVLATAYQVGKGIVREIETAVADAPEEVAPEPEASDGALGQPEETAVEPDPPAEVAVTDAAEEAAHEPVFAPKRMTFDT